MEKQVNQGVAQHGLDAGELEEKDRRKKLRREASIAHLKT